MKRFSLLMLFIAAFIHAAVSQETWRNYYSSDEIKINYRSMECHDNINGIHKKLVLFQFVNLTERILSLSFDKQMWYNDRCIGCDNSPEQHFTMRLAPKQIIAGSCEDKKAKSLYIVEKMLNAQSSTLTKFDLTNISISN